MSEEQEKVIVEIERRMLDKLFITANWDHKDKELKDRVEGLTGKISFARQTLECMSINGIQVSWEIPNAQIYFRQLTKIENDNYELRREINNLEKKIEELQRKLDKGRGQK